MLAALVSRSRCGRRRPLSHSCRIAAKQVFLNKLHTKNDKLTNQAEDSELKGKVALVTGSTSGIGLDIAKVLASKGCTLILNGFGDAKQIGEMQTNLSKQYNVRMDYSPADMSKPLQIKEMIRGTINKHGSLDILVNNAGIQHVAPIESFPEEDWEQIIRINLSAPFYTTKEVLPTMREKKWGRIINIASVHGLVASTRKAAYVASKHGVVGFTKVTALETAGTGITANSICPGWTRTPLVEKQIEAKAKENNISYEDAVTGLVKEKQPSGKFVQAEHLGKLVAFLCTSAGEQITGSAFNVDGGWLAQ